MTENHDPSIDPAAPGDSAAPASSAAPVRRRRADLHDWIQEACITRVRELGLDYHDIADDLERSGKIHSPEHIKMYLTRRASMGSHALQHLMHYLGLEVMPIHNKLTAARIDEIRRGTAGVGHTRAFGINRDKKFYRDS
jgi:hypothetical protein